MELRPYQKECVDILDKTESGRHIVALATGLGKCLGRGTPVLMYDGSIRPVEQIKAGDIVMGPDGKPRLACGVTRGTGPMYRIIPEKGTPYTVNGPHVLSFRIAGNVEAPDGKIYRDGEICNISVTEYLDASEEFKSAAKGWRTGVEFPECEVPIPPYKFGRMFFRQSNVLLADNRIPPAYLHNSKHMRMGLLRGIMGEIMGEIQSCEFDDKILAEQVLYLARSLGYDSGLEQTGSKWRVWVSGSPHIGTAVTFGVKVVPIGTGEYFGFELIGTDRLFLLGDFTVTHNTVIFSSLKRNGRTLILSHRDELVRQPEKYYDCPYGIEKADETSNGEEVVSASIQSLAMDKRLKKFSPDEFDTVIVDEAHHAAAPTYKKVLNYFSGARRVFGFTATPKRGDNVRLNDVFKDIIFSRNLQWGIENDYLCGIRCKLVNGNYSLLGIKKTAGDYNLHDLEDTMDCDEVMALSAKVYIDNCHEKGRHTLIYCISKSACEGIMASIRELIPDEPESIQMVTGETPSEERKQILEDFSSGKIKAIVNCMVLTEGTDLPICDAILNLRPTCNTSLYTQIVGRGTRMHEGKDYCLVIDVIPTDGNERMLCTAPTLFGVNPMLLDGKTRERFDGEEDLAELCDTLRGSIKDFVARLEYEIENINRLLDESEKTLNESKDLKDYILNHAPWQTEGSQVDAGRLFLRENADDEKAYVIYPNYYQKIYLSKPDVLGNTTIRFHVTKKIKNDVVEEHYIGELPWDEAIDLALKYCQSMPEYYRYCWDKEAMKRWKEMPCTEKQADRLSNDLRKYNINTSDSLSVSKLDASLLIDHMGNIKERKAFLKEFGYRPRTKASIKAEKQKRYTEKAKETEQEEENGRKKFLDFKEKILRTSAAMERKRLNEERRMEKMTFYEMEFTAYGRKEPPTSKQTSYLKSLLDESTSRGYLMPEGFQISTLNMRQCSCLISMLTGIKKKLPCLPQPKTIANVGDILAKSMNQEQFSAKLIFKNSY